MGSQSSSPVTRILAEFIASVEFQSLSDAVVNEAKRGIADCIGGAIGGVQSDVGRIAINLGCMEAGPSAIWGTPFRTSSRQAALANGVLAHAHDLDDTNLSMRGHPSAPVVPAMLALGDEIGASGKDLITAYVVGIEIAAKLGRAMNLDHYLRGWHTTSTLGSMGAAAAAAKLLRLSEAQTVNALAIATSTACGVRANWGTMTKPLHVGLAAQNGVLAGQYAAAGLTGNPAAIEADGGFFFVFCGPGNAKGEKAIESLGEPFDVISPGLIYKKFPTCALTHLALDILLPAIETGEIDPDDIEAIRCGVGFRCATALPYHSPTTGLEGKFSMEYCITAALVYRQCSLSEFEDAKVQSPEISRMMKRLSLYIHPELTTPESIDRDFTDIEIVHRSGRRFHRRASIPEGDPRNPLSWEQLQGKFETYASPVLGSSQATRLWSTLRRLDEQQSVSLAERDECAPSNGG